MSMINDAQRSWLFGTVGTSILMLGSLWLGLQLSKDAGIFADLSMHSEYSLSSATHQLLTDLEQRDQEVILTVFKPQSGRKDLAQRLQYVTDLFEQVTRVSSSTEWQVRDLDRDREVAQRLGVTQYGSLVVQIGDSTIVVPERKLFQQQFGQTETRFVGETALREALQSFLYPTSQNIYTLEGSGERSFFDGTVKGLSNFHALLESKGYAIRKLNLLKRTQVPADAAAVFVMEPATSLSDEMTKALSLYVQRGGRVWLASTHPEAIYKPFALSLVEGAVVEKETQSGKWNHPIVDIKPTEYTGRLLTENHTVVFGQTPAFEVALPPVEQSGVLVTTFVGLTANAWVEKETFDEGMPQFDETMDWKGSGSLVVAMDIKPSSGFLAEGEEQAKLLVMGDVDWLTNGMVEEVPSNEVLAQALLDWFFDSASTSTVGYRSKERLVLTQPQLRTLRWLIVPMPLLFALLGVFTWRKRST